MLVPEHVGDAVAHPIDVLLDRDHHVREHGRALRAGNHEEVRETSRHHSKIGPRPVGPFVTEEPPVAAADVDPVQGSRHRVEAGGKNDGVEYELLAALAQPPGRNHFDRLRADVHEADIWAIERFEIVGVDTNAFCPDWIAFGRQQFGCFGILHDFAYLVAHELRRRLVGVGIRDQIVKGRHEARAAVGPALLIYRLAFCCIDFQRRLFVGICKDAVAGLACLGAKPRIVALP